MKNKRLTLTLNPSNLIPTMKTVSPLETLCKRLVAISYNGLYDSQNKRYNCARLSQSGEVIELRDAFAGTWHLCPPVDTLRDCNGRPL